MDLTPETRKPAGRLTPADFAAFPVWEYALDEEGRDGRDETWVRPLTVAAVPRGSYTIVAADFRAPGGREYAGCLHISRLRDPVEIGHGVVFYGGAAYLVPSPELAWYDRALAELLGGLGLARDELFPLAYRLRARFDSEWDVREGMLTPRADRAAPSGLERQRTFW